MPRTKMRDLALGILREIADGTITSADIAAGAIDSAGLLGDNVVTSAKIADNNIGAAELNVSGNGTSGQVLASDGDGTFSWADAPSAFSYNAPTGTSQTWDIGSYNYFNMGTLSANTTVAFSNIATEANWEFRVRGNALSKPWDASSLESTKQSINIQSLATAGGSSEYGQYGLFFKPDGTKFFTTDSGYVNSYTLSTAWRLDTATYERTINVRAYEDQSRGLFFKPDGTIMYVIGFDQDGVSEFALSTAWDTSTASFTSLFNTPPLGQGNNYNPYSVSFKSDGTKMFIGFLGNISGRGLYEYSLSTAWDSSTASFTRNTDLLYSVGSFENHQFKSDGTKIFFSRSSSPYIYEATLSTAWDTSTMGTPTAVSQTAFTGRTIFITSDGTKFFRQFGATVARHDAETPYTVTLPTSVNIDGLSNPDNVLTPAVDYEYLYKMVTSDGGTNVTRFAIGNVNLF